MSFEPMVDAGDVDGGGVADGARIVVHMHGQEIDLDLALIPKTTSAQYL